MANKLGGMVCLGIRGKGERKWLGSDMAEKRGLHGAEREGKKLVKGVSLISCRPGG